MEVDLQLANEQALVAADRFELEQVLVNLVLNAVDASGGTGQLSVHVLVAGREALVAGAPRRPTDIGDLDNRRRGRPRADRWLESAASDMLVRLIVTDSGPGVSEGEHDRIFDPFFTTKAPGQGTGLGLAIVARIVENLHGTVWIQNGRERGASFHVLLPAASPETTPAERPR
jgi:signal transduction histidine kinase